MHWVRRNCPCTTADERASLHVPGWAGSSFAPHASNACVRCAFPADLGAGARRCQRNLPRRPAHAGARRHLLLAPAGSVMDVCNQPGAGRFRSECLTLDPTLVERFAVREASLLHSAPPPPCVAVTPMLAEVWAHAMHGWETPTDARAGAPAGRVAAGAGLGPRRRLAPSGQPGGERAGAPPVAGQTWRRLARRPGGRPAALQRRHLRRQLARERAAFSDILRECRLGQALMLLQTSPGRWLGLPPNVL